MSKSKSVKAKKEEKEEKRTTTKAIDLLFEKSNMVSLEIVHARKGCPDSDEDHEALEEEAWGMFESALKVAREAKEGPRCGECADAILVADLAALARTMVYLKWAVAQTKAV